MRRKSSTAARGDELVKIHRFYADQIVPLHFSEVRWFDKAGQAPARKTLLVANPEDGAVLSWKSAGAIVTDDARVERLPEERVQNVIRDQRDVVLTGARCGDRSHVIAVREFATETMAGLARMRSPHSVCKATIPATGSVFFALIRSTSAWNRTRCIRYRSTARPPAGVAERPRVPVRKGNRRVRPRA